MYTMMYQQQQRSVLSTSKPSSTATTTTTTAVRRCRHYSYHYAAIVVPVVLLLSLTLVLKIVTTTTITTHTVFVNAYISTTTTTSGRTSYRSRMSQSTTIPPRHIPLVTSIQSTTTTTTSRTSRSHHNLLYMMLRRSSSSSSRQCNSASNQQRLQQHQQQQQQTSHHRVSTSLITASSSTQHDPQQFRNHRIHSTIRQYWTRLSSKKKQLVHLLLKNSMIQSIRRKIITLSLALIASFWICTQFPLYAIAVTGGRMGGGSFKSSSYSRTTTTRTLPQQQQQRPSSSTTRVYSTIPRILPSPLIIHNTYGNNGWYGPQTRTSSLIVTTKQNTVKDIAIVTGTGMLLASAYYKNRSRNGSEHNNDDRTASNDSLLGSGYTVGSITVSLNVPNRLSGTSDDNHHSNDSSNNNNNILHTLNQLALSADTMTKRGLQDLLSSVTIELLRQEQYITSAYTDTKTYNIIGQAEREFQLLSVRSQSNVDSLTVNRWNSPPIQNKSTTSQKVTTPTATNDDIDVSPTIAIVTINFAVEGDSTILPTIKSREDVHTALTMIASDALVGECLMTAEIVWSPEDTTQTLSKEETYRYFPNLVPV